MHGSVAQQSTPRFILGLCSMIQHLSGCNKAAEHLSAGGDQLGHYIRPGIESGQQGEWFFKTGPELLITDQFDKPQCCIPAEHKKNFTFIS